MNETSWLRDESETRKYYITNKYTEKILEKSIELKELVIKLCFVDILGRPCVLVTM